MGDRHFKQHQQHLQQLTPIHICGQERLSLFRLTKIR